MHHFILLIMAVGLVLSPSLGATPVTKAATPPSSLLQTISKTFHVPPGLSKEVAFWTDIYTKHDSNHVVIHDKSDLGIVYGVVSLEDLASAIQPMPEALKKRRLERVEKEMDFVRSALLNFHANPNYKAKTKLDHHIVTLFKADSNPDKYKLAASTGRLRSQTGQRDKFEEGLRISGRYMPAIESTFKSQGVPLEITRLIFVESMFNVKARSRIGASGIWQFMPSTGKLYMTINDSIDERNDPFAATVAAAKLLKKNYQFLGSWPLAINAYNSGPGRLRQASKQFGDDIVQIVKKFDHPSYQFASRNFYPCFLAVLHIYEKRSHYFGEIDYALPIQWDLVTSPAEALLPQIATYTETDPQILADLNPSFTERVIKGKNPIPAGFQLRVPEKSHDIFLAAYEQAASEFAQMHMYVVKRGDTLYSIAKRFKTTPDQITSLNNFPGQLIPGLVLQLPASTRLVKESFDKKTQKR